MQRQTYNILPKANKTANKIKQENTSETERDFLFYIKLLNTQCLLVHYKLSCESVKLINLSYSLGRDYQTTQEQN